MKLTKYFLAAALLALGTVAHAQLISEGFNDVTTLTSKGWVLDNRSAPVGITGWYQGDASIFAAQSGPNASYVAANYNNAGDGGDVNNWLISPTFSTAQSGTVSFYAKADILAPYVDTLKVGFSTGGTASADFLLSPVITVTGGWVQYSFAYAAGGAGSQARFAIDYTGPQALANYVGIDTFAVTPVPEPTTWALMGIGLVVVAAARRRQQGAKA